MNEQLFFNTCDSKMHSELGVRLIAPPAQHLQLSTSLTLGLHMNKIKLALVNWEKQALYSFV